MKDIDPDSIEILIGQLRMAVVIWKLKEKDAKSGAPAITDEEIAQTFVILFETFEAVLGLLLIEK